FLFFLFLLSRLPRPPLFPYTTLFRSGRFAAKEAFVKALRAPAGMSWQDVEVITDAAGAPSFVFHGKAADRVHELGVTHVHLSISDRKSTRLNSSHVSISYAVFCLKKK